MADRIRAAKRIDDLGHPGEDVGELTAASIALRHAS